MTTCQIETNSAKIQALDEKDLAQAGVLFMKYLDAFFEYAYHSENKQLQLLIEVISECPLCESWLSGMQDAPEIFSRCNAVNIGPMELLMGRDRAKMYCADKLEAAGAAIKRKAWEYFDSICNGFDEDIRKIGENYKQGIESECNEKLFPLYKKRDDLKIKNGKKKTKTRPYEIKRSINSFIESVRKSLSEKIDIYWERLSAEIEEAKAGFVDEMEEDLEYRCKKIMESARDIQDEREFDSVISRNLRNQEREYMMLQSSIGSKIQAIYNSHVRELRKELPKVIQTAISKKTEELQKNILAKK